MSRLPLDRRSFLRDVVLLAGFGTTALATIARGSTGALAVGDAGDWVAEGAEISTRDGTVDSITFGGAENGLVLVWEGFDRTSTSVEIAVLVRGADDGDPDGWNGGDAGAETAFEALVVGEHEVTGAAGEDTLTWADVFDDHQPVDVAAHTEIDLVADFSADGRHEERTRELDVRLVVTVPTKDLELAVEDTASIVVENSPGHGGPPGGGPPGGGPPGGGRPN